MSLRFLHLNIVGRLLKRRPTKGGAQAPQDPPSYALVYVALSFIDRSLSCFRVIGGNTFFFVFPLDS